MNIINQIQYEFEKSLIEVDNSKKTWDTCVSKYAYKVYEIISSFKQDEYFKIFVKNVKKINIYIEACMLRLVKNEQIPSFCHMYVILKYPFLTPLLYHGLTKKEWIAYRSILLNDLNELFGEESPEPLYKKLYNILTTDIENTNNSSLNYFQYLYGFNFIPEGIGLDKDKLKSFLDSYQQEYNVILINVTFNLENINSVIVYKNIPKYKNKLLNDKTIDEFKPYFYKKPEVKKTPYSLVDNNFATINKITKNAFIVLDYNNGYYTLAIWGDSKFMTPVEANNLLSQKVYSKPPLSEIMQYIKINFYDQLELPKDNIEELKTTYHILVSIINDAYDNDKNKTIQNILNSPKLNEILVDSEIIYFKIYVRYIKNLLVYNRENVTLYILGYIYQDYYDNEDVFN